MVSLLNQDEQNRTGERHRKSGKGPTHIRTENSYLCGKEVKVGASGSESLLHPKKYNCRARIHPRAYQKARLANSSYVEKWLSKESGS
jgi:hypothetical protein